MIYTNVSSLFVINIISDREYFLLVYAPNCHRPFMAKFGYIVLKGVTPLSICQRPFRAKFGYIALKGLHPFQLPTPFQG